MINLALHDTHCAFTKSATYPGQHVTGLAWLPYTVTLHNICLTGALNEGLDILVHWVTPIILDLHITGLSPTGLRSKCYRLSKAIKSFTIFLPR
jgi:hypothetical protein